MPPERRRNPLPFRVSGGREVEGGEDVKKNFASGLSCLSLVKRFDESWQAWHQKAQRPLFLGAQKFPF